MNISRLMARVLRCSTISRTMYLNTREISSSSCAFGIKSRWRVHMYTSLKVRQDRLEKEGKAIPYIRSNFLDWNYDSEIYAFGKRLGEEFDDTLLRQAMTDASYIEQEKKRQIQLGVVDPAIQMSSNAFLAQQGKALMTKYIPTYLRGSLPLLPEEGIREITDYLTSTEVMSEVGHGIGLKDLILKEEHPPSPEIVARTFEAVVATLKESSGLDRCNRFIKDFVIAQLVGKEIHNIWNIEKPFNVLSNIITRSGLEKPEPRLVFHTGRETLEAVYHVAIYSDKQFIGSGYGESIPVAKDQAAHDALTRLFHTTLSADPLPLEKDIGSVKTLDTANLSLDDWSIDKAKNIIMC